MNRVASGTTTTVGGLYDFLYREYSTQGRWPSPDPAGLAAVDLSDPQSLDRYSYVRNDPVDFVDPLGLQDEGPTNLRCSIAGANFSGAFCDFLFGWLFGRGDFPGEKPDKPDREDKPRRTVTQIIKAAVKTAVKTAVCAVTQPLQDAAYQNRGALGIGVGGSVGIAPIPLFGIAVEGSVQLVADPRGNVGIAFSGGANPGLGVFGRGAVGGAQFTNSTAPTIFNLRGPSFGASGSAGAGVGVGIEATRSMSSPVSSISVTLGGATGTKGAGYSLLGTAVPSALSVSCR